MSQRFELQPSRYLAVMLGVAHAACLAMLPLLALPLWAGLLLAVLLLSSLCYHVWRDAWLHAPDSCLALVMKESDVVLLLRDGRRQHGRVVHGMVTPLLTVLSILPQDARMPRSLVVLPDGMSAEAYRQLRVWLRWGVQGAQ